VEAFRYHSRRACAVLNIAAALSNNKVGGSESDWFTICCKDSPTGPAHVPIDESGHYSELNFEQAGEFLKHEVSAWLDAVSFGIAWSGPAPSLPQGRLLLEIDYRGSLFPAIGLQLGLTLAGAESLFMCSGCGLPYVRENKLPNHGQSNFCRLCTGDGSYRDYRAKQQTEVRRREKVRASQELHAKGVSDRDIAKRLKVRNSKRKGRTITATETVRRWIEKGH
jgi:hypothetical protein